MRKICLLFLLLFLTGCSTFISSSEFTSEQKLSPFFFTNTNIGDTHAYHIYKNQYKDEIAKVCYLINLVRYSPLTFTRHGQLVNGHNAGRWLDYKLDMYYTEIETVEDFIENVGSHSRKWGTPYYVNYEDNKKIPMKTVYYNELRRLYEYQRKMAQAKEKAAKAEKASQSKTMTDKAEVILTAETPPATKTK